MGQQADYKLLLKPLDNPLELVIITVILNNTILADGCPQITARIAHFLDAVFDYQKRRALAPARTITILRNIIAVARSFDFVATAANDSHLGTNQPQYRIAGNWLRVALLRLVHGGRNRHQSEALELYHLLALHQKGCTS